MVNEDLNPDARVSDEKGLVRVSRAPGLFWVDYQALTEVMNFYRTDPVREWDCSPPAIIRSVRIRHMLQPASYRRVRRNLYRVHCQFVSGNDRRASISCSYAARLRLSSKPAHPKALHRRSVTMAACFGRPLLLLIRTVTCRSDGYRQKKIPRSWEYPGAEVIVALRVLAPLSLSNLLPVTSENSLGPRHVIDPYLTGAVHSKEVG
jgi:hypothetical protein